MVNSEPPEGVTALPTELNIPGPALLLLVAAALKLNPPGAGAVQRNNGQKERQLQKIDKRCLSLIMNSVHRRFFNTSYFSSSAQAMRARRARAVSVLVDSYPTR